MACARCGCGIYKTEDFISLNKVWHTNCFSCYQCEKPLNKHTAKIFQGELFCKWCYSCVIESLFEVISTPSLNKPCKVFSTPSCSVNKSFDQALKNCQQAWFVDTASCKGAHYLVPIEKSCCLPKAAHSCSCLPNNKCLTRNEYFMGCCPPLPREVANYYNRSHMKSKACKDPQPKCPTCGGRKVCCSSDPSSPPKCIQIRPLKCCCDIHCPPQNYECCSPPPTPFTTRGRSCYLPDPNCCEPCPPVCPSPRCPTAASPCQCSSCKPKTCCLTPNCPISPRCPSNSPKCPINSSIKWCPPKKCLKKTEECIRVDEQKCCCKNPPAMCRYPKYCVCGNTNPCNNCKISQIRAQCTVCCNRCGQKVYAAEKVLVSSGAYHTSCFTCYCCNKCLDVKTVYEGCGEIYCKQCYSCFFGIQYYGFGAPNC